MKILRTGTSLLLGATLAAGAVSFATGCEKEGPAEQTGEAVDNAVQDAGRQIDKAADKTGDAVKDATH